MGSKIGLLNDTVTKLIMSDFLTKGQNEITRLRVERSAYELKYFGLILITLASNNYLGTLQSFAISADKCL